ncbi:MAG: UDP-N-acetylmuramoyl-L-alanyl-D-glutamate--2,6-diaminopimelate ligase [Gammaproteobacteria bacterium]|nr:UDP-N-acetylmuramoyl-L-alanyl-D-glutamate--2,6-diaminopimelate ligase [Gammaproteobacteria bacterium]
MNLVCDKDMDLRMLFDGFGVEVPQREIVDITTESLSVRRGGLFLALRGSKHHGLEFVPQALAAGPSAIAWEPDAGIPVPALPPEICGFAVPGLGHHLGEIANRFFATPSAAMAVMGITGTNGKTTVAWLVTQALGRLGEPAGYMGTLGHGLGTDIRSGLLTTPGCITLHRQLRELADAGARHAVMEVSSHALDQQRVDGVHFSTVAFTNLGRDHLDYHHDMQHYAAAKARLFKVGARTAVINLDDAFGQTLAASLPSATACLGVSMAGDSAAGLRVTSLEAGADGLVLEFGGEYGTARLESRLWGRFNAENLLLAAGILLAEGQPLARIVAALAECTAPPGRMQRVPGAAGQPAVLVDFAHTADALRKALEAARAHCCGRLWCVFGCGGNRDSGKRAPMGGAAVELADQVIVTDDNPRDEDSRQIIADILAGMDSRETVQVIPDRATAIQRAIHSAGPDDVVLLAGKGHEQTQIVAGVSRPFSDAAVAAAALSGMQQGRGA